ncbi:hypothetical protein LCGC14_0311250 [marine sediment metagenome]|uniref:Uncharacterized protein n=1 Tax=marine sediment metagenome TaxID=412755 RepID=A0A0F9U4W8_9ZZZZ
MTELLLVLAVAFTVGHVIVDTHRIRHIHELIPAGLLIGHIIFTGELARWLSYIPY